MRVRVLGCSGGIGGAQQRTTALQVDDDVLIDCGTGVTALSFEALLRIDHIFITHAHLDHIACLPLLVDTVGEQRQSPITVYATEETLRILRSHIFNWLVWPDFTAIPDRVHPFLRFSILRQGETAELPEQRGSRRITAIPALHSVPAVGYWLAAPGGSLVFSGDTTVCDAQLQAINQIADLRVLIVETAFPDAEHDLALAARHLCPSMLFRLLDRIAGNPEVFVTHLKPGQADTTAAEIARYAGRLRPRLLAQDQVFEL